VPEPPDDCWFEVNDGKYATNKHIVIAKDSPRPFKISKPWVRPSKEDLAKLTALIEQINGELVPHTGWFDPAIAEAYMAVPGIKVLATDSNPQSAGLFMTEGRELLAAIMPMTVSRNREGLIKPNP
jgi:hypothetical protein